MNATMKQNVRMKKGFRCSNTPFMRHIGEMCASHFQVLDGWLWDGGRLVIYDDAYSDPRLKPAAPSPAAAAEPNPAG